MECEKVIWVRGPDGLMSDRPQRRESRAVGAPPLPRTWPHSLSVRGQWSMGDGDPDYKTGGTRPRGALPPGDGSKTLWTHGITFVFFFLVLTPHNPFSCFETRSVNKEGQVTTSPTSSITVLRPKD